MSRKGSEKENEEGEGGRGREGERPVRIAVHDFCAHDLDPASVLSLFVLLNARVEVAHGRLELDDLCLEFFDGRHPLLLSFASALDKKKKKKKKKRLDRLTVDLLICRYVSCLWDGEGQRERKECREGFKKKKKGGRKKV